MEKSFVVNYVPTLLSVNQKSELMLGQPIVSPILSKVFQLSGISFIWMKFL